MELNRKVLGNIHNNIIQNGKQSHANSFNSRFLHLRRQQTSKILTKKLLLYTMKLIYGIIFRDI